MRKRANQLLSVAAGKLVRDGREPAMVDMDGTYPRQPGRHDVTPGGPAEFDQYGAPDLPNSEETLPDGSDDPAFQEEGEEV